MSIEVRELRSDESTRIQTFLEGCEVAGAVPPELFDHRQGLALIAERDKQIIGLVYGGFGGEIRHFYVAEGEDPLEIQRVLIDKLLLRVRKTGLRRYQIQASGEQDYRAFWEAVRWMDPIANDQSHVAPAGAIPAQQIVGDQFAEAPDENASSEPDTGGEEPGAVDSQPPVDEGSTPPNAAEAA